MIREHADMRFIASGLAGVILAIAMVSPAAAETTDDLRERIEAMERQLEGMKQMREDLEAMKAQLRAAEETARVAAADAQAAQERADAVESEAAVTKKQAAAAEQQARGPLGAYTKWHLAGYAKSGFRISDKGDEEDTFLAGSFNPVFHFQYKDLVLFEGELEVEVESDGETDLALEYASIDLLLHDYATFKAGKFLSPIGQFQQRLHPAWVNKLSDAPAGFGHGGVQPLSEVGVMLTGGFPLGPLYLANYTVFGGNGPRLEIEDGKPEALEIEGFGEDENGDKSVGGRIGILPIPHLEIGGSFMTSDVETPLSDATYTLWGADASYTRGPIDLRFEYLSSDLDAFSFLEDGVVEVAPDTEWEAWYVQLAYQLRGLTDMDYVRNLEPVIRYGEVDVEGFGHFVEHTGPEDRLTFGLNYLFAPSVIAKLGVSLRDFEEGEDTTEFLGQVAYGF